MTEQKPFNDVTNHLQRIEGYPSSTVDFETLPKPIRYFGYFFVSLFSLSGITILVLVILQYFK